MEPTSTLEPSPAARLGGADEAFPLTPAQREMWFASQLGDAASLAYHESTTLRLTGPLQREALHRALPPWVARHEALRLRFHPSGATQYVVAAAEPELIVRDLLSLPADEREAAATQCIDQHLHRPFDLEKGPPFRVLLLQVATEVHLLTLVAHHIVCDGWSLGLLNRELGELYSAAAARRPVALAPAPSFAAHARREADATDPRHVAAEAYWLGKYRDGAPALELPTDRPRPAERSYRAAFFSHALRPELAARLRQVCGERQCTPFALMISAWAALLHRLTGQEDIAIGVPAAGQLMGGADGLVGHFANLLPMRLAVDGRASFAHHLVQTKQAVGEAMEHWRYPFGELLRHLHLARDGSRMPLAAIVFQASSRLAPPRFEGLAVEGVTNEKRYGAFDLNINILVQRDEVVIGTYYNTDLFDRATLERWLEHFETLLGGIADRAETPLDQLPVLSPAQREQLLVTWNRTALPYRRDAFVHQLFAEQAERHPEAIALVAVGEQVSYGTLQRRAQRLATRLRAAGIGPDVPVGLFLDRTSHLLEAVLGVLQAGGAYVPLDRAAPAERLAFIVRDTQMPVVVTQRSRLRQLPPADVRVVLVDEDLAEATDAEPPPRPAPSPENLAYVIYTSGSTGQPKGVGVPHRAVAALVAWAEQFYSADELSAVLYATSAAFDVSVFESLVPLCLGGTIYLADDILHFPTLPYADRVRLIGGVPSAVAELVRARALPLSVATVNVAGEPCPQTLVDALYELPHVRRVVDVYGPTETTVYSTGGVRQRGGRPTIGRPLPNEQTYILDAHQQPVPIGVRGELYIAGEKLARGYLHRPELTAQRFLEAPFQPGLRLYRTGDGARYLPDGQIEYLGRLDDQVKIRGYRIEPGEIQAVLSRHPEVAEAVVLAQPEPSGPGKRLVAYLVARPGATPTVPALREHVLRHLPEYMCPGAFLLLEAMPRNPSGKVDRRALPNPAPAAASAARTPPRSTMEQILAEMWVEVLGVSEIGVHDNFFALGGHSLLAAQVIARIDQALGVTISYPEFFAAPTIATLAATTEAALVKDLDAMG